MLSIFKTFTFAPILVLALFVFSCKGDDPIPTDPDVEKVCLVSQSDQNGYQLNYTYNAQKKLATKSDNFANIQTYTYLSDTLVQEGTLSPTFSSTRNRYILFSDGKLKSITFETWNPQTGFGLVQANVVKQEYNYLADGSFSGLTRFEANYFIDSASLRPLGTIKFRRAARTIAMYTNDNLLATIESYFINQDGTEWLSSKEEVADYQTEEIGNAKELSSFWMANIGQNGPGFIGKPLIFGQKVPRTLTSIGGLVGLGNRVLNFRLNELNQVEAIDEEIDNGFGFPFTSTYNFQWICQ